MGRCWGGDTERGAQHRITSPTILQPPSPKNPGPGLPSPALTGSQGLRRSAAGPRTRRAVKSERRSETRPGCLCPAPPARAGRGLGAGSRLRAPVSQRSPAGSRQGQGQGTRRWRLPHGPPPVGKGPGTHLLGVPGLERVLVVVEALFDGRHLEKKDWRGGAEGEGSAGSVPPLPHPIPSRPPAGLSTTRVGAYLYCPRPRPENLEIKPKREIFSGRGRAQRPPRGVTRGAGGAGQGLTAAAAGRGGTLRGAQVGVLRGRVHHAGVQRRVRICSGGGKGAPVSRDGHGGAAAGAPEGTEGREERAPLPQPPETTHSGDTEP